jgi:hypothetical protein
VVKATDGDSYRKESNVQDNQSETYNEVANATIEEQDI